MNYKEYIDREFNSTSERSARKNRKFCKKICIIIACVVIFNIIISSLTMYPLAFFIEIFLMELSMAWPFIVFGGWIKLFGNIKNDEYCLASLCIPIVVMVVGLFWYLDNADAISKILEDIIYKPELYRLNGGFHYYLDKY